MNTEDNLISEEELINAKKARIIELKNAIESVKSLGFQAPHDMIFELEHLENSVLVNYELIPTLTELLEQEFSKFNSDINLLLRYSPKSGLDISFYSDKKKGSHINKSKCGKIKIEFQNGDIIKCMFGGETLAKFIETVGAEKVYLLKMKTGVMDGKRLIVTKEQYDDMDDDDRKPCAYKSRE